MGKCLDDELLMLSELIIERMGPGCSIRSRSELLRLVLGSFQGPMQLNNDPLGGYHGVTMSGT
jgi:hypothetical protein